MQETYELSNKIYNKNPDLLLSLKNLKLLFTRHFKNKSYTTNFKLNYNLNYQLKTISQIFLQIKCYIFNYNCKLNKNTQKKYPNYKLNKLN